MGRPAPTLAMIAVAVCCVYANGTALAKDGAAGQTRLLEAYPMPADASALASVPNLAMQSVTAPYFYKWQKSLRAFQLKFQAKLAVQRGLGADPIETGAITGSD